MVWTKRSNRNIPTVLPILGNPTPELFGRRFQYLFSGVVIHVGVHLRNTELHRRRRRVTYGVSMFTPMLEVTAYLFDCQGYVVTACYTVGCPRPIRTRTFGVPPPPMARLIIHRRRGVITVTFGVFPNGTHTERVCVSVGDLGCLCLWCFFLPLQTQTFRYGVGHGEREENLIPYRRLP
jgi:hypothetical protein